MKNRQIDLHNHLFAQLERLADEDLTGDLLRTEIERSRALAGIAKEIVANSHLALKAAISSREGTRIPKMLMHEDLLDG